MGVPDYHDMTTGAARELRKGHKRLTIAFVLVVFAVLVTGWANDHASCERNLHVRVALNSLSVELRGEAGRAKVRANLETGKIRQVDLIAARQMLAVSVAIHTPKLTCTAILPTT